MTSVMRILVSVAILVLIGTAVPSHQIVAAPDAAPGGYVLPYRVAAPRVSAELELVVLNLLNRERVAAGRLPLMPHAALQTVARQHGTELFAYGYLSHRSRDGRTPLDRVLAMHLPVRVVGENLAYALTVTAAHAALVASTEHRDNLLSPDYHVVGIGVLDGGASGVIVVEMFGD